MNIVTTIMVILTLAYVLFHLNSGRKPSVKKDAYMWWYMPWFALVYVGLMYLLYNKTNFPYWPLVRDIVEEYKVETIFFLLCAAIWTALEYFLLRSESIHKKLIGPFRKLFAGKRADRDRVLPFPYFIDAEGCVRTKVGQVFYRWTMKVFVLIIALVYIVFFLLTAFANIDFYLTSGLGLLALIPLVDYYVYLCVEAHLEEEIVEGEKGGRSDFDELWQLYVETFPNYSVAWKRTLADDQLAHYKEDRDANDQNAEIYFTKFTEEHKDIIFENWDLTTAFINLERYFSHVEQNGKYILIAIDIPSHFVNDSKSYIDEIADRLGEVVRKDFYVYDNESTKEDLNNSIILAPLSLISDKGLFREWMEKIGLVVVVNIFDKNVSNIFECMRFSYVLQAVNPDYQIVFVTPQRKGVQSAFENTWKRKKGEYGRAIASEEMPKQLCPNSRRQFFIGYNYEDYNERLSKVYQGFTSEPLYSGSEMMPIALSSRIEEMEKTVTPVHYLELSYTNAVESIEEVSKFRQILKNKYSVAPDDINKNTKNHVVPIEKIKEEQLFSVIFDHCNNAPAVYSQWQHLGEDESFSIVISKPYLFRDYFNANHSFFVETPIFAALQPHPSKSRVTLALVLLKKLKNTRVEENELLDLLSYYYGNDEIKSVSSLIKELFATYFTKDLAKALETEDVVDFDGERYNHHIFYKLNLFNDRYQDYLDTVTVTEESGNELFDILSDLVEQNYGRGQIHSFSGRPYKIKDYIKGASGKQTLIVSKVNNKEKDVSFYRAELGIKLTGNRTPIKEMNPYDLKPTVRNHRITNEEISIVFDGFETNMEVKTLNWYEFNKYTTTDKRKKESTAKPRKYSNGKVLKMTLKYIHKPEYIQRYDDIRKSLQILLYEAMWSFFPQHAQYLIISSLGEGDAGLPWIFNSIDCSDKDHEGELTYFFIEDAHIDLGLIGALADPENIMYIFRYLFDYLIWLTEGKQVTYSGYDAYLNQQRFDKYAFLKYGRDDLPNGFDVTLLINFIRDFFDDDVTLQKMVENREERQEFMGVCDFCQTEMENSKMVRLSDGRMRCPKCSEDAVDTLEQFRQLCQKAKELFKEHLNIDFNTIPHEAKLVSAVELHKKRGKEFHVTNGYDVRKLLGMARIRGEKEMFFVEDGRKPDETLEIIAHEMTHIWEYQDEQFQKVRATDEDWTEGLAVWTELFLMEKHGVDIESNKASWLARNDEYGRGLKKILDLHVDNPYEYIREKAKEL